MASAFYSQHLRIAAATVVASLVLSLWCLWADPVINNDGIHYIRAADRFLDGRWGEAIAIYSWPFYPVLISVVSSLTGLDTLPAAHALNTALCAVAVLGFLAAVHTLGGSTRTLLIAAIVILAFPTLNKYRPFVIRDIGFLAFYLWSVVFWFSYWKERQKLQMLWWLFATLMSLLFRAEAAALLVVVPIVTVSHNLGLWRRKRWMISLVLGGGMVLVSVVTVWMYRDIAILTPGGGIDNPADVLARLDAYLQLVIGTKLNILKEQFAGRYYIVVYAMIIVLVTILEIIRRLAVVYALLAWWGLKENVLFPAKDLKLPWLILIAINTLVLFGSSLLKSFVVDRYALAAAVTVLLASPFVFDYLLAKWKTEKTSSIRWLFPVILVACIVISIRGLDVFTDKRHLLQAGQWIEENAETGSSLHSNNRILIFYSGMEAYHPDVGLWRFTHAIIKKDEWENFDYVAISLLAHDRRWVDWLDEHLEAPAIKMFSNQKGDMALVYKTSD